MTPLATVTASSTAYDAEVYCPLIEVPLSTFSRVVSRPASVSRDSAASYAPVLSPPASST